MKKRFLALSMMLCMLFTTICTPNFVANASEILLAAEQVATGECGDELTWELNSAGQLILSGSGAMWDFDEENPSPWTQYKNDIKAVIVGEGVTSIGNNAFFACENLTNIRANSDLKSIGASAFEECTSLYLVSRIDGLETIGTSAFSNTGIAEFTVPGTVTSIGDEAFYGCIYLSMITFEANEAADTLEMGRNVFGKSSFVEEFDVEEGHASLTAENGVLFTRDKETLLYYPAGKENVDTYTVPTSVKNLNDFAFYEASLKEVVLPEGLLNIGDCALNNMQAVTSITIPSTVATIGDEIGGYCPSLICIENLSETELTLCPYENVKWADEEGNVITTLTKGTAYQRGIVITITLPAEKTCVVEETFTIPDSYEVMQETYPHSVRDMVFTSSDEDVAIVSEDGVVTALEVGESTLTAASRYGNVSYTCKLTVEESPAIANDETGIPDENFYNKILEVADSNEDGILTEREAGKVTKIEFRDADIEDITGIKYLTALKSVSLSGNKIVDILPLSALQNVEILYLSDNKIEDISALDTLAYTENLKWLFLENNRIKDFTVIEELEVLEVLFLDGMEIENIDFLADATSLTQLSLSYNNVSDLTALRKLTKMKNLYLDGNEITNINSLSKMKNLEMINLSDNLLEDFAALGYCEELKYIYLDNNKISDISDIELLYEVLELDLSHNQIVDISPIGNMYDCKLEWLDLSYNLITDRASLEVLEGIETVILDGNPFITMNGLQMDEDGELRYYTEGEIDYTYVGLAEYDGVWYYVENGTVNYEYTGLVQHYDAWFYVEEGILNWEYTGLVQHYDAWFYVEGGQLNWNYTGLVQHYDAWFYVEGGQLNWNYTGLVQHYDAWFYVEGGQLNWDYTGLVQHYDAWFYVEGGQLNWSYTGLVYCFDTWFYVEGGQLNCDYVGLVQHYDAWFYVEDGKLDWNYTGLTCFNGGWFYVEGGQLNWGFKGIAFNENGFWYVRNGIIDWNFVGEVTYEEVTYSVVNGSATPKLGSGKNYTIDLGDGETTTVKGFYYDPFELQLIKLINDYRLENGLNALEIHPSFSEKVDIRGYETAYKYSHYRPNGKKCTTVFDGTGFYGIGENIAAGYQSPETVFNAWKNSESHNDNMLNPNFKYIGVSCFGSESGKYDIYWVLMMSYGIEE